MRFLQIVRISIGNEIFEFHWWSNRPCRLAFGVIWSVLPKLILVWTLLEMLALGNEKSLFSHTFSTLKCIVMIVNLPALALNDTYDLCWMDKIINWQLDGFGHIIPNAIHIFVPERNDVDHMHIGCNWLGGKAAFLRRCFRCTCSSLARYVSNLR